MVYTEFWDSPVENWRRYAVGEWQGKGRVEEVSGNASERVEFASMARESFLSRGIPANRIRTWLNVQMPDPGEGYDAGYPHVHQNGKATTLVHYLDPGDVPADLHIFDGNEVVEVITPEAGKTVFMPNGLKHGVLRNQGKQPRIALIATAYP